jgi:nitrite reductase (NADH) large subunit
VLIDDKLGICAELEAEMTHVVGTYQCEWKEALEDPDKLSRFRAFVNTAAPDPSIVSIPERAQRRPAYTHEKRELLDALTAAERGERKAS